MIMKRIGLIGCGTIGTVVAKALASKEYCNVEVGYLCDVDKALAEKLNRLYHLNAAIVTKDELVEKSDLVVEAASGLVAEDIAIKCLQADTDVLIVSIGGLIKPFQKIKKLLQKTNATLYLPSGAICGVDGLLGAARREIREVMLTTRKPLKGLVGAPYFDEKGIDLESITSETVIFEGTAEQAIHYFPKNINVAALLSIAGLGVKKTQVRIMTSPSYTLNSHEIVVKGDFGTMTTKTENVPSPSNPKTSYLAALSVEATLEKIFSPIKIGT